MCILFCDSLQTCPTFLNHVALKKTYKLLKTVMI